MGRGAARLEPRVSLNTWKDEAAADGDEGDRELTMVREEQGLSSTRVGLGFLLDTAPS